MSEQHLMTLEQAIARIQTLEQRIVAIENTLKRIDPLWGKTIAFASPDRVAPKQLCYHDFEATGPAGQYFCVKCKGIFER